MKDLQNAIRIELLSFVFRVQAMQLINKNDHYSTDSSLVGLHK